MPSVSSSLCPRVGALLRRLRDEGTSPALRGVRFAVRLAEGFPHSLMTSQFCIPPAGYRGCERGVCRVRADGRSQGQF